MVDYYQMIRDVPAWKINTWVFDNSSYLPLLLSRNVFLYSLVFYIVISIISRQIVKAVWPGNNNAEAEAGGFISQHRKRDTVGRWTPSLIHATLATIGATCAGLSLIPESIVSNEDVIMHSLGYFLGDLLVDRDPDYILHHVGPLLHSECMLRVGAKFWHTMRAGWIMEGGNVVAHTAAVLTFRKGPVFHKINTWSFWISRPASYYDGFMAWYADIPESLRWTLLGVIPLIGIVGVYYSNTKWMFQMCRTRKPKPKPVSPSNGIQPSFGEHSNSNGSPTNGSNGHSNGNGHTKLA